MPEKELQSECQSPPTPIPSKNAGCLFQLAAICAGVFLVTVLGMIATAFGDSGSPAAAWLMRHSGGLMAIEVAAILIFCFAAMAQDRGQTQRQQHDEKLRQAELTRSAITRIGDPEDVSRPTGTNPDLSGG